jgi:hypothetical protein
MAGFDGICFVVRFGTPAANNDIRVRQETTAGGAYADLTGTLVNHATNNQHMVDIGRTGKRFIKCRITRGTSTTIDSVIVIQYGARTRPVIQPTASVSEKYIAAVEGTA